MVLAETKTVLVTENEPLILELISGRLASREYKVLQASSGEEALSLAERYPQRIHLLVADIALEEMDGLELADRLTAERPDMRVLYTSSYCDEQALGKRLGGKRAGFLPKPFTVSQLLLKIERMLRD